MKRIDREIEDMLTGFALTSDSDREEWERQRTEAETRREALRTQAKLVKRGVPAKDADRILADSLKNTKAMKAARSFLENASERMLVLSGSRGCGKTTAAAWIAAQRCPDEYRGYSYEEIEASRGFVPWPGDKHPRFVDASRLARVSRYRDEEMKPLEECSMLVIDDLGIEFVDEKGSFLSTLDGLINARYAANLRTVITTNLRGEDFKKRYGERISDRIREVGRFVEIKGPSMRTVDGE